MNVGCYNMRKYITVFMLFIMVIVSVLGMNLETQKKQAIKIVNKQNIVLEKSYDTDVYIINSTINLKSRIKGDLILENSSAKIKPEGNVNGKIYIINSKVITSTTEIKADYSVAKISGENKGVEVSTITDKKSPVEKPGVAFLNKIKFNFSLFLFLLLIYYLLKTQIIEQKNILKEKFLKDILMGLIFWILFPFVTVLLLGSVIGIPVWLIFILFVIFGLLMGLVVISLWVGEQFYGKKKLLGFITGYVSIILIDYIIYSLDSFVPFLNVNWLNYLYWIALIFISTGITVRFVKSIVGRNKKA